MSIIGFVFILFFAFIFLVILKAMKFIWIIFFIVIFFMIKNKVSNKNKRHRNKFNFDDKFSNKNSWSEHFNSNDNNSWNDNSNNSNKYNQGNNDFKIDREKQILLLAVRFNRKLTISDIVMNSKLSSNDVEKLMKSFVDNFVVETKMSEKGVVVYNFPELFIDAETVSIPYNDIKDFEITLFYS